MKRFSSKTGDTVAANPIDVLDEVLEALTLPGPTPLLPFAAGAMGFLAYDLKNQLERLPTTAVDDLNLPDMVWSFPGRLVVHDRCGEAFLAGRGGVNRRPAALKKKNQNRSFANSERFLLSTAIRSVS